MAAHIPPCDAPVLAPKPDVRIVGEGIDKAGHGADQLRRHGGNGRACHTPPKHDDEQQIQSHVQHCGKQQEQQRCHRITHAAQERADEVIEQLRADTGEDDGAVGIGGGIDLMVVGRHVDPRQHGVQQHQRQCGQHHRQRGGQNDLRGQRPAYAPLVVHPHVVGGDDAEARADAEGELQENEYQRVGVVDTGHLRGGQGLADDGGVADGIDLLQQVGQDHRQGKQQDHPPARALCQVHGLPLCMCCFHRKRPLVLYSINNNFSQSADYNAPDRHCQGVRRKICVNRRLIARFMAFSVESEGEMC